MANINKIAFNIFFKSIRLYFSCFDKFIKYMNFPVLGQTLGLFLIFAIAAIYSQNLSVLLQRFTELNNINLLVTMSFVVILPGLAIFTKALWEYLVAYGAINSMLENLLKSKKVYDFDAHTQVIKRRSLAYIGLWSILSLFMFIAFCPLFWVIGAIVAVYIVLVFQVFTFEPEQSALGCLKRSFYLIKGHFAQTFFLIFFAWIFCYILIPQIFVKILFLLDTNKILFNSLSSFLVVFPIDSLNSFLQNYGIKMINYSDVSSLIVELIIMQILIQYTLPMRSIMWALWYKELNKNIKNNKNSITNKKSSKRPSEKLMEESNKKFGKKKLDRNLIERASKKDME